MDKYLIEYIKGGLGSPDFERVTLLNPDGTKNKFFSGDCLNLRDLPIAKEYIDNKVSSFKLTYTGVFQCRIQWQDYRKEWHDCDQLKAYWCIEKGKPTRIIMKFIK